MIRVSLRPNYFIFIGYLKRGGEGWGEPVWIRHCIIKSLFIIRLFIHFKDDNTKFAIQRAILPCGTKNIKKNASKT